MICLKITFKSEYPFTPFRGLGGEMGSANARLRLEQETIQKSKIKNSNPKSKLKNQTLILKS